MWLVDGDNHMTVHIPQYITPAVATVVNRMRKSHAESEYNLHLRHNYNLVIIIFNFGHITLSLL